MSVTHVSSIKANPFQVGACEASEMITADQAVAGLKTYAQLACNTRNELFWIEYCPESHGRNCLVHYARGQRINLTPVGFDVRSRVHEYGGLSWCLISDDVWLFVNAADQQLYVDGLDTVQPQRLTESPDVRYGEPVYDRHHQRVIVIEEEHNSRHGVTNRLVSISLNAGLRTVLHEGHDFYADIAISADGAQLSFVTWNHPDQPWTRTQWHLITFDPQGSVLEHSLIAGQEQNQSIHQPRFGVNGDLFAVSDETNWWNLCRVNTRGDQLPSVHNVWSVEAECITAPWQFGQCNYVMDGDDIFVTAFSQASATLVQLNNGRPIMQLAKGYTHFQSLAVSATSLFCVAASPHKLPTVIAIDRSSGRVEELTAHQWPLNVNEPVVPESLSIPLSDTKTAGVIQGFIYSPPQVPQPPLVVFLHGGPTACTYPALNPKIQYWVQRGFAVLDLNYRGSTGFGREFRMSLNQAWGVSDVEDAEAAVRYLIAQQRVDQRSVFIRGSSAGGFTALAVLVASDCFAGGASLYGVTDPLTLAYATHKFESFYLHWLIGDPVVDCECYEARAPFLHSDKIQVPVIFFQGEQDTVVVPEQTHAMAGLLSKQVRVEEHYYEEEGHGFRQHANQVDALEKEYQFYCGLVRDATLS